jgi:hypothetical protein
VNRDRDPLSRALVRRLVAFNLCALVFTGVTTAQVVAGVPSCPTEQEPSSLSGCRWPAGDTVRFTAETPTRP